MQETKRKRPAKTIIKKAPVENRIPKMILKPRRTFAEMEAVYVENDVAADLAVAMQRTKEVPIGRRAVAYLCGPPGLGKSYTIEQGIKQAGKECIRSTRRTIAIFCSISCGAGACFPSCSKKTTTFGPRCAKPTS